MNFDPDPADEEFRAEAREFFSAYTPKPGPNGYPSRRPVFVRKEVENWTRILQRRGWLVPSWPEEWGGTNWSAKKRYILMEEYCKSGCPDTDRIAIDLVGPVLYTYGTAEQKHRYLPRILNGDDFWCQGFSEPQAGSDLSLIRTRAMRDGDYYVINGQKIWTTNAHNADMMFALVRVSAGGRLQQGLSFLLISMHAPGVTVRPIITIDGGHWVNEVFFQDVRVPARNLVGEEGRGWVYARYLLANERVLVAAAPQTRQELNMLKAIARKEQRDGRPVIEDPLIKAKIAQLEIDLVALEYLVMRELDLAEGDPMGDRLGPILKVRGAELRQRVAELSVQVLGDRGIAYYPFQPPGAEPDPLMPPGPGYVHGVAATFMFRQSATIAAGSNEIQRNILASAALGL